MTPDKPFTLENAWMQLNIVADPVLRHEDDELPDGMHPERKANIALLRNSWGAPRADAELKAAIKGAYEAGDRLEARRLWGQLILSIYPVHATAPAPKEPLSGGFSLQSP